MGFELKRNGQTYVHIDGKGWETLMQLADRGGWQRYETDYDSGQEVHDDDAMGMAAALESMLDDIPDINTAPMVVVYTDLPVENDPHFRQHIGKQLGLDHPATVIRVDQFKPGMDAPDVLVASMPGDYQASPVDYWSGPEGKSRLREIIRFLDGGGFEIW